MKRTTVKVFMEHYTDWMAPLLPFHSYHPREPARTEDTEYRRWLHVKYDGGSQTGVRIPLVVLGGMRFPSGLDEFICSYRPNSFEHALPQWTFQI